MARTTSTTVIVTDDYSGKTIEGEAHEVTVIIDGEGLTLDLAEASVKAFETAVSKFLKDAPRVPMRVGRSTTKASATYEPGFLASVRAWAKEQGHEVYERGIPKREFIEGYKASLQA